MLTKSKQAGRYSKKLGLKKIDRPESDLQSECEEYLEILQIQYIHIPDGAAKKHKKLSGIPDLVVLFPNGRHLCIELKTKSKVRQSQWDWKRKGRFQKSVYHFVQTFDNFKLLLDKQCRKVD